MSQEVSEHSEDPSARAGQQHWELLGLYPLQKALKCQLISKAFATFSVSGSQNP